MRRDAVAMLFWALRWHEGHRVSYKNLADVLWGDFRSKPQDAAGSIRELMGWVEKRYGDKWIIEDCKGKAFRILPRPKAPKGVVKLRRHATSPRPIARKRPQRAPGHTDRPVDLRRKSAASSLAHNQGDIGVSPAVRSAIQLCRPADPLPAVEKMRTPSENRSGNRRRSDDQGMIDQGMMTRACRAPETEMQHITKSLTSDRMA